MRAVKTTHPILTVARDIVNENQFDQVIREALQLCKWAKKVIIVPKAPSLAERSNDIIPRQFLLGYSVPSRYGNTPIDVSWFKDRKIHLLGGHPARQREIANKLDVFSIDCNRLTLDAAFGDYFDGETFRPHPIGGYERCIRDSIEHINWIWKDYSN